MRTENDWRLLNQVEHLQGQSIDKTDAETLSLHLPALTECVFCWRKITVDPWDFWYLPIDHSCVICATCYNDFATHFHWQLLDGYDITW